MKKLFGVICAAMLVFGLAGQAMAGYAYGDLVQFIYEGTTDAGNEFNTGLGSVKTGELTERTITAGQPGLGNFGTSDWDDLYAGFTSQYSYTTGTGWDMATVRNVFFATTNSTLPSVDHGSGFMTFSNNASGLITTAPTGVQPKAAQVSYWETIEMYPAGQNTQGAYSGFNHIDAANGFANLGILDDVWNPATQAWEEGDGSLVIGNYVDMYLWQYVDSKPLFGNSVHGFVDIEGEWNNTHIATLRIGVQDDGLGNAQLYTQINPVPVPAAVWLLGSGLLGLFGIRRRNKA